MNGNGIPLSVLAAEEIPDFPKWCKRTEVSLSIVGRPSLDEWRQSFRILSLTDKASPWHIGDSLNDAEGLYGEECYQEIDANEELEREANSGETYRQYQQVACRIPRGSRLPPLSWGHHQTVAYLEPERRDELLHLALTERLTRDELRKIVRREQTKKAKAKKVKVSEVELIHTETAQAYFDACLDALKMLEEHVPENLPSARQLNHAQQGQVLWQKARTIEKDCLAIVEMFDGIPGTYLATDSDISCWLIKNSYFITDADLDDRLDYMVGHEMLRIADREDSRQEGRRGSLDTVYELHPKLIAKMKD